MIRPLLLAVLLSLPGTSSALGSPRLKKPGLSLGSGPNDARACLLAPVDIPLAEPFTLPAKPERCAEQAYAALNAKRGAALSAFKAGLLESHRGGCIELSSAANDPALLAELQSTLGRQLELFKLVLVREWEEFVKACPVVRGQAVQP
jgi:hypothetical protein